MTKVAARCNCSIRFTPIMEHAHRTGAGERIALLAVEAGDAALESHHQRRIVVDQPEQAVAQEIEVAVAKIGGRHGLGGGKTPGSAADIMRERWRREACPPPHLPVMQ